MNKYSMPAALRQTGDAGGPSFTTGNALGPQAGRLSPAMCAAPSRPTRMRLTDRRKRFFFEKKNQKTFAYEGITARSTRMPKSQSFCFFFQKEALPYFT
jgi:hypothetical protein